jgi:hypothetical protein
MAHAAKKNQAINPIIPKKDYPNASLCKKANSIQEINHKLKKYLDPSLHDHFELANIKTDVAILLVNSSNWATRLRYNIPVILDALNNQLNFTSVKTIRIKVKKIIPKKVTLNKKPIPISKKSAQILADVAHNFNDPELRSCLLKLSKNYLK